MTTPLRNQQTKCDPVGRQYGSLTVIKHCGLRKLRAQWLCRCECGTEKVLDAGNVRSGRTVSCGCLNRAQSSQRSRALMTTHGQTAHGRTSATYESWRAMRDRCSRATHQYWQYYGGRGITVCDAWRSSFEAFVADMGPRPEGTTLDRIDNDGNYEPGNCRWATPTVQRANRRDSQPGNLRDDLDAEVAASKAWHDDSSYDLALITVVGGHS